MPPPPPTTTTTRPAPALPNELLEEIFLRLPPDEPACLVRASLTSKLWLGLLSGPGFRGRYREFHGAPPMLGFFCSWPEDCRPEEEEPMPHFVSTTKFGSCIPDDDWGELAYAVWDCRHGRVLLGDKDRGPTELAVWDPMMGCRRELYAPREYMVGDSHGAAVLCAVSGCDHRACYEGPFRVVFVGLDNEDGECFAYECVCSGEWSKPCSVLYLAADAFIDPMPPVLIEDALHFMLSYVYDDHIAILKYDLGSTCLSLIDAPLSGAFIAGAAILMAMEDGSLGFAHANGLTLHLWSRQMGSDGVAAWTQRRVIDIKNLLPIQNPKHRLRLIGSVEGSDIIFVSIDVDIYEINLKSLRWKKLWKRENFHALIPYMSFYNPRGRVSPCNTTH